jgi:demethylmenaquinone methyltransferase/2-methoxy-6-polyprenyl-1,4-benzoquinol methylase
MTPPGGNTAATADVATMFDRIAGVYDAMNAVISGFQEPRWRRRLADATGVQAGMAVVDVATGTGKVAAALADRVGPFGRVVGVDVSAGMVAVARRAFSDRVGLEFVLGDALALPLPDDAMDAATIAFGMRNVPDYARAFAEMARVVRPGGVVACLEIARPGGVLGRLGRVWFERIVPLLGRLVGQGGAYAYLVTSVAGYPPPDRIAAIMREAGLGEVTWTPLTFGMVTLHTGRVPGPARSAGRETSG